MKRNIGILVDSSSGLSQEEAKEKGIYFVPLIINFNGEDRFSGVNIDNDFLFKNLNENSKIQTSAFRRIELEKVLTKALDECEKVLILTISKHLSSSNDLAKTLVREKKLEKKVIVYDSEFLTPWFQINLIEIEKLINKNDKLENLIKILEFQKNNMKGYVIPSSLDLLYRGGRITKAQYLIGSKLKIFPLITVNNGSLIKDKVIKTRTILKTINKMVDLVVEDHNNLYKTFKDTVSYNYIALNINEEENMLILKKVCDERGIKISEETFLSPAIVSHLGKKSIGFGIGIKKI